MIRPIIRWGAAALLCAVTAMTIASAADTTPPALDLPFTLMKPAGAGPFPAVVILHDCSGLGPKSSGSPWRWGTRLQAGGYVTIWPDSFSGRGHPDGVCVDGSPPMVTYRERARDAYAALAYLKTLPFVDGKRVAVMGGSHGGTSTLVTIVDSQANATEHNSGFAAAIALYPGCAGTFDEFSVVRDKAPGSPIIGYVGAFKPQAPLLILSGQLDDWTPAAPCQELATRAKAAGHAVDIVVYPGAHHSFDSRAPVTFNAKRRNGNAAGGLGATTGGNAEAWADAVERVNAFLSANLAAKAQ